MPGGVAGQGGGLHGDGDRAGPAEAADVQPGDDEVGQDHRQGEEADLAAPAARPRPQPLLAEAGVHEPDAGQQQGRVEGEDGPEPGQVRATGRGEQDRRQDALHEQHSEDHPHRPGPSPFPVVPRRTVPHVVILVGILFLSILFFGYPKKNLLPAWRSRALRDRAAMSVSETIRGSDRGRRNFL